MNSNQILLKLQEGKAKNYFKGLKHTFGGDYTDTTYQYKKGKNIINIFAYPILPDFEIMVTEIHFDKSVLQQGLPDNDPELIHIYIAIRERLRKIKITNNNLSTGTNNGVFVYDGMFPVETE